MQNSDESFLRPCSLAEPREEMNQGTLVIEELNWYKSTISKQIMLPLHALIFDVDGTLADTERFGHRVAFNRAFAAAGLDWHWSEELYGQLLDVTGGKERIAFYLDRFVTHPPSMPDRSRWIADLHAAKTQEYQRLLAAGEIPLRPGVKRLIQEARDSGVRLAIATTTTPENATTLLETALGADSPTWFDLIAAGDIVPHKKPASDIYDYALQTMQLTPETCLAIEDSQHGLASAVAAGIPTVVTVNDYTQHQFFTGARLVLSDLGEPDRPFEVLAGECDGTYLTIELAGRLLEV